MSITFSLASEPWQIEFENEEINDERWSCLVSAIVESEPEDEECLKILNQCITTGKMPLVRTINMTDVVSLFKTPTAGKKKEETKVKKVENVDGASLLTPPPRFTEIVPFLSKHASISDGSCKLVPGLMAYALKYLILSLKDQDYHCRRVARTIRRRTKEAEMKAEMLKTLKGGPPGRVTPKDEENNHFWHRTKFDIFNDPFKDGPLQSPELYIVLHDFYDPFLFPELLKLKIPFRAVAKLENFRSIRGRPATGTASKKSEIIKNFWKLMEGNVSDDVALLKYSPPCSDNANTVEVTSAVAAGFTALLYSIFNVDRLHQTYIQQLEVHRMIESLELLDLSKCVVYNELCDALIREDSNAEIFVLFSMIEQVVAGVPETRNTDLRYETQSSIYFEKEDDHIEREVFIPEEHNEPEKTHKVKGSPEKSTEICFYGDKISLAAMTMEADILKYNEMFDRFVVSSILGKIRKKFATLTPALKAQNDFNFYRIWHARKENKDSLRLKISFLVAMRLIERTKAFGLSFGSWSSRCDTVPSVNENTQSSNEDIMMQNESGDSNYFSIDNLFYQQFMIEKMNLVSSSVATKEVHKAEAISDLENKNILSFEDLEVACGRCPKLTVCENSVDYGTPVKKLEQFLESYELSQLTNPNLLADQNKFKGFVEKHNFYETFEPNRTAQKLQELFDEYNTAEYTYFSPTDTLFVLGHNDSDFRGVYHSSESAFIPSPLSLRDFVRYFLPANKKWMRDVNAKYIKFLRGVEERMLDEEKRKDHEFRCGLMKTFKEMTDKERRKFLDEEPSVGKDSGLDNKKGARERETGMSAVDLDDLPEKVRQKRPDVKFFGVHCGGLRMQVNIVSCEFYGSDGSTVGVKKQSWLRSEGLVTFTVQRHECRLFVYRWLEDKEKRMMLFREPSGIMVNFGLDPHPFPVKITQPNGLLIDIVDGAPYIRQTYLEPYKWGDDIAREKSRCCFRNGSVVIFSVDGTVEVLYPSGTKHICRRLASGGKEVEIYETLTPLGVLWVRNDCSKCKHTANTMMMMVGVDSEREETYYRREDGTNCMLWSSGKLVTTYPDGTKITTTPKFEEDELMIEVEEEEGSLKSSATSTQSMIFSEDPTAEVGNGFTVVTCSILIEHPKYATVYTEPQKLEVRILGRMKAEISSKGSVRIECRRSVVKATSENTEFYTVCRYCEKRSVSKVFLGSEDLLSKSRDYDGKRFYVYGWGQVLYRQEKEFIDKDEEKLLNNTEEKTSEKRASNCEFHRNCRPQRRCLIIERDLTGMEFIDENTLQRYLGSLSEDAYYDLEKYSSDKVHLQHGFFDPVYQIGRDKYVMKYEKDDGVPTRLTRKDLRDGNRVNNRINLVSQRWKKEIPKVVVARYIGVLQPDPVTVMKEIMKEIVMYRRSVLDLSNNYDKTSKKVKQGQFARYVAKELELIASTLCPSLKLYQHTCSLMPYTEIDIHSAVHNFERSNYFVESNPVGCRAEVLPRCKRIPKPLRYSGNDEDISEVMIHDDEDDSGRLFYL